MKKEILNPFNLSHLKVLIKEKPLKNKQQQQKNNWIVTSILSMAYKANQSDFFPASLGRQPQLKASYWL